MKEKKGIIIELIVQNHPGVMSHITGLFSRRGFNLEAILCAPMENSAKSRMYLLVSDYQKIEQIEKQLQKLYDVLYVRLQPDYNHKLFLQLEKFINPQQKRIQP